ncbi:MAG: hypothetical protein AB7G04_02220 [Hyphomonadaceae bacterium]
MPPPFGARQRPWDSAVSAPLPPGVFTPWEEWAWARIIRGDWANMSEYPGDAFPVGSEEWLKGRDDGGGYDLAQAANWPAHRSLSARFLRTILFHEPWASARDLPWLRIFLARFPEELDWSNAEIGGEINLQRCCFAERVNWIGLRADFVVLTGSRFEKPLLMDSMKLQRNLVCDGLYAMNEVRMIDAGALGTMNFGGAVLDGALRAEGLTTGGGIFFNENFHAKGEVRLIGGKIGGSLDCKGATFDSFLQADRLIVEGDFFLRDMVRLGAVMLPGARLAQDLYLSGSTTNGVINLTGAVIGGELNLGTTAGREPKWGTDARLILRNAKIGALAGGLAAFRRGRKNDYLACELTGFSFERLGGLGAADAGSTLAGAAGNDLRAWLRTCRPKDHFDPGPYRALAKGLREAGRADRAADVLNALGNYELVARGTPLLKRLLMLPLSWLLIGYGQRNHRAFMWFVALILGAAVVGFSAQIAYGPPPAGGWADKQAWFSWLGFSLGDAIPVVTLDKAHETFLVDHFCAAEKAGVCAEPAVPQGLTAFFYAVKILGFIILSYLAAGLSGLAQQKE